MRCFFCGILLVGLLVFGSHVRSASALCAPPQPFPTRSTCVGSDWVVNGNVDVNSDDGGGLILASSLKVNGNMSVHGWINLAVYCSNPVVTFIACDSATTCPLLTVTGALVLYTNDSMFCVQFDRRNDPSPPSNQSTAFITTGSGIVPATPNSYGFSSWIIQLKTLWSFPLDSCIIDGTAGSSIPTISQTDHTISATSSIYFQSSGCNAQGYNAPSTIPTWANSALLSYLESQKQTSSAPSSSAASRMICALSVVQHLLTCVALYCLCIMPLMQVRF